MISNKDRSGYFGASDTNFIVGNWETKTFEKWWLEKIGIHRNNFSNEYTQAGTHYEHKILDYIAIEGLEKDKQFIKNRLRANLDGSTLNKIYEVKTYSYEKGFKLSKQYINQVNVQMYASDIKEAEIVAYGLVEKDYKNYFNDIDPDRLSHHEIKHNEQFITKEYLPKLEYLTECLIKGLFPNRSDYERKYTRIPS